MRRFISAVIVGITMIASSAALAANITVMSWNAKRLGSGNQHSYQALAMVASQADLIALQEVMNEQGAEFFRQALEKQTKEKWSVLSSHLIGSSRYKEMYSFVYRTSAVEYEDGAVVYTDRWNKFFREPFSARFRSKRDGSLLALASIHVIYGDSEDDRVPEIKALADYWTWLGEVYPQTPRMLVGDFNMPPSHPAWASLYKHAAPLITKGASTLSASNGRYASLYDNIFVSRTRDLPLTSSGIIDYPRLIGWTHEKSRKHVSDHAPVFVTLGGRRLDSRVALVQPEQAKGQGAASGAPLAPATQGVGASLLGSASAMAAKAADGVRGMAGGGGGGGQAGGPVRGNASSMIYHRQDCPFYDRVGAKNRVEFNTPSDAERAGYRLAGNCQ